MTWLDIIAAIGGMAGILTGAVSLFTLSNYKRDRNVEEGKKAQDFEAVKAELADLKTRAACLEQGSHSVDVALAEIKTILERVVADVRDLGAKLDRRDSI